jgi:hypothetical protein
MLQPALVVVVIVPIVFRAPAVLVFIPPPMPLAPTTLPRLVQFTTLVIRLRAASSVSLDCLVESMIRVSDSALTLVDAFCLNARHCGAKQSRREND